MITVAQQWDYSSSGRKAFHLLHAITKRSGWLAIAMSFLFAGNALASDSRKPPNIVFILADDLGWADVGCYGNRFNETPNIDKLASQGMKFTDFYAACPVCSPTRASIMSGRYQARFGLTDFIPGHWRPFEKMAIPPNALALPRSIVTAAEALKAAGYVTGHLGKWHLGGKGHMPTDQGFDYSIVTSGRHEFPKFRTQPRMKIEKGKRLAEFLTDQAIGFMKKNKERPFFLYLCHYAVHIPLSTTPELQKKYENKKKVKGYPCNPTYAGLLEEVDISVGRLMAALDQLGLTENTILIFTSDNGGLIMRYDGGEIVTSNLPLRGEKGSLYEGGVRVPLIIRWPGHTKAGSVCHVPAISTDFYRTFLDAAKARAPKNEVLDSVSLVPLMRNPQGKLDRQALFWHYPHYHHSRPASAVRAGDWKAIEFFDTGKIELYNLKNDISEKHDLATAEPDKAKEMRQMLRRWRSEVDAQMPQANPAYNPKRADEWWSRRSIKFTGRVPKRQSKR